MEFFSLLLLFFFLSKLLKLVRATHCKVTKASSVKNLLTGFIVITDVKKTRSHYGEYHNRK